LPSRCNDLSRVYRGWRWRRGARAVVAGTLPSRALRACRHRARPAGHSGLLLLVARVRAGTGGSPSATAVAPRPHHASRGALRAGGTWRKKGHISRSAFRASKRAGDFVSSRETRRRFRFKPRNAIENAFRRNYYTPPWGLRIRRCIPSALVLIVDRER
jgi:hypothetical protein